MKYFLSTIVLLAATTFASAQTFSPTTMIRKPIPCYSLEVFEKTATSNGYVMVNYAMVAENTEKQIKVIIASFLNPSKSQMLFVERQDVGDKSQVCILGEGTNLTFPRGAHES